MTEKDTVSMTTVQLKPDYAASEVYSTASEPPPAYKRQANSVKIAKITAFTIIVSSFILGAFILASSYLQAKASCDQVQALDSVLEKELMLETLQQVGKELPRAEPLLGAAGTGDESELQNLDTESRKAEHSQDADSNDKDNSYSDSDETDEMQKYPGKMPLELDLSDLAAAILRNNKKSRMNCVVERKHAEEIVDSPSKTVALPFGVNLTTDPKKARITGERISIFCDGGEDKEKEEKEAKRQREQEEEDSDEDAEPMRPMFIPFQRVNIPFGRIPDQMPLTHMPQRMMPPAMQMHQQLPQQQQQGPIIIRQLPPPFQHLPMRPPMPPQVMQAPRMESSEEMQMPKIQTLRIHMQQLPFREIHVANDVPVQIPAQQQQRQEMQHRQEMQQRQEMQHRQEMQQRQEQRDMPQIQIQPMPFGMALQRVGITPEDLRNIQRMAEDRITDELRRLAAEEGAESSEGSEEDVSSSGEQATTESQSQSQSQSTVLQQQQAQTEQQQEEQQQQQQQQESQERQEQPEQPQMRIQRLILQPLPEQPRDTMTPPMPDQPQQLPFGRMVYGRSLATPVRIPVPMMQAMQEGGPAAQEESQRPHFVQPRSV
ncbi:nuclear transcription factor Y subunit beta isoform X2 [Drosophila serrata]|uniref:nuclear transcription factor Y subunit beta isoform X2 n=1 Tax=Drosophila serrata TaxID=7274 RepID=UPI000A1D32BD|nr:nuclear transcription factor Y subunit beta isoform X2 [Drosophila serrata]